MRKESSEKLEVRLSQYLRSIPLCKCESVQSHIAELKKDIPEKETLSSILNLCNLFSNINRLKIIFLLLARSPRCNCEIEVALGLSQSTISHHIQVLKTQNIINIEYSGKWSLYSIKNKTIGDLLSQIKNYEI